MPVDRVEVIDSLQGKLIMEDLKGIPAQLGIQR
jgi:hypothetical protein